MSSRWLNDKKEWVLLFVILCGLLVLLLANLGNQYLWEDEAQTALVSKTILTEGVPCGYDGKNFFSQEIGAEYGKNYIWRWHTWLPFYVLAGFYKVFGVSIFVSRLPFVLFGFGTVAMTYILAKEIWASGRIALISAGLLAVCVPFILLCRQCRYYSMAMFFTVFSLYAYAAILNRRKYAGVTLFVGSTLLFHSQHIYVGVLFVAVLLHAIIFHRDRLKLVLVAIIATVLVNAPWLVWLAGMHYPHRFRLIRFLTIYVADIVHYVFPLWLLAVVLIVVFARRARTGRFLSRDPRFWEKVSLPVFFVIVNVITVASFSPLTFFRYLGPAIPLLILLIAVIIDAVADMHWLLAVTVAAILVTTSQLKDYFYEITHDYEGPIKGIAKYLNEHGSSEDVVAITYGDMPLKFHTKMRVVGGLTGEDLEPAKDARWVIIRKHTVCSEDAKVRAYLVKNVDRGRYRKIVLNSPDISWENREDPANHLFRTRQNVDKVVIYEKIN